MARTWIVVCDGSRARFFMARADTEEWVKFEEFEHPASRVRDQDLVTDRPGRQQQSQGRVLKSGMTPRTDPHDVEELRFAHYISQTLDSAHALDAFDRLILVAPPAFLGLLRRELSSRVRRSIHATLDKDYSQLDADQLHEHIVVP
jgi:protein required for attachment to host cells